MNTNQLFALYDRVADAPDAVPRLRKFVLDLAVRGRLVKQDPADEPVEELLKRISVERKSLINAKRVKKIKVDLIRTPFPLPPLAEQHRIVAKVNELMALCDQLEKVHQTREETRDNLTKASLIRLEAPDPNESTFHSHVRFAVDALPALTARTDQIKHLRRVILNLAVRGKLVRQDPDDEPANALLKRIANVKERMAKAGKSRGQKIVATSNHPPFLIPKNWYWAQVREVTSDRGQKIPDEPFTYVDVSAIDKENGLVVSPRVLQPDKAPSRARKIAHRNDVIYSCVRPYLLNIAVIEDSFNPPPIVSTAFEVLSGHGFVLSRYIWIVLRSPFIVGCVEKHQRGQAYPAIKSADFAALPFPLPPLAEQHRIVAKVGELMAICDQLEAGMVSTDDIRAHLLESFLHDALVPATHEAAATGQQA